MKRIYWRIRIILLALRWIPKFNLGDKVLYAKKEWTLIQGRCSPYWDLSNENDMAHVHERDFRKVRSIGNYAHSFISGYRFYMNNWYAIWVNVGIEPWMLSCIRGKN